MKKLALSIQGMHCASCASNIERSLRKIPAVKSVSVSLLTSKGFIEIEGEVSEEALKAAVARAGYRLTGVEQR